LQLALSYDDVLLIPRHSETSTSREASMSSEFIRGIVKMPFANSPMDTLCGHGIMHELMMQEFIITIPRFIDIEDQVLLAKQCGGFFSVGSINKHETTIDIAFANDIKLFLVDMAHGDTKTCIDTVKYLYKNGATVMAGNVATADGYMRLYDAGAKYIRVGIGGGSACTTRRETGFGIPTLQSILWCANVKPEDSFLIADGGIETVGDIVKSFVAGADICMLGKMLASTSLATGERKGDMISYRGMSSKEVKDRAKCGGSVEGVSGYIKYTGETHDVIEDIKTKLATAMTYYGGCRTIDELRRNVEMVQITQSGLAESKHRMET